MPFRMIWGNLALMDTDAVVNAAYPTLRGGDDGVHGAICRAAGRAALEAALAKIGWCEAGGAVVTPGFGLRARGIIHAVAPTWQGGHSGEAALLAQAYRRALALAAQHGYRSVAFPPLGAGDFGFSLDVAVSVAVEAIGAYLLADGELDVALVLEEGAPLRLPAPLRGALAAYVRENAADVPPDTPLRPFGAYKAPLPPQEGPRDAEALPEWLRDFLAPKRSPWQAAPEADALSEKPAGAAPPTSPLARDDRSFAATPQPPRKGVGAALAAVGGLLMGLLKLLAVPLRLLARAFRRLWKRPRGGVYRETRDEPNEQAETRKPTSTLEQASIEDLLRMLDRYTEHDRRAPEPEARPAHPWKPSAQDGDEAAEEWPFAAEIDGHVDEGPFATEMDEHKSERPLSARLPDDTTGHPPIPPAGMPVGWETDVPPDRAAARKTYAPPQADVASPQWLARRIRPTAAAPVEQGEPPVAAAPSGLRPPSIGAPPPMVAAPSAMPPPLSASLHERLAKRASPSGDIAGAARSRTLQEAVAHVGDTFSQAVLYLIDERGMSDVEVYKRANLGRKLFSKLRSDKAYQPSKQTAVALCIALALNLDDALDLLARAGYTLAACNKADLIAAFFIEHSMYDIFRLNEALFAYGQACLGA